MSSVTRRFFAALIPAAPVVARSGIESVIGNKPLTPDTAWHPSPAGIVGNIARQLVYPKQWKEYEAASEAVRKYRQYRYEYQNRVGRQYDQDVNILALKSVSQQHKIHMMLAKESAERERDRSAVEKLIDLFGVREFLDKRHSDMMDESPQVGRNF